MLGVRAGQGGVRGASRPALPALQGVSVPIILSSGSLGRTAPRPLEPGEPRSQILGAACGPSTSAAVVSSLRPGPQGLAGLPEAGGPGRHSILPGAMLGP